MMPCPYRNHQNSLKSSQFYLLHVFYSVQFSGNWRVKPKRKAAATTKSLGTIKANTMADTAISLVAELVTPSCHLHWQCVIVNFSTITVFPVGSNTIWNDNYTSTKTSLLQQEKKNKSFRSESCFHFCFWQLFLKRAVLTKRAPLQKKKQTTNQSKDIQVWLHKPAIPARGSLNQKIWSRKLVWAKKGGPVLGRKNLKENKEKCKPSQCGREQETGAEWSSLSTTDVTVWLCSRATQPVTSPAVNLPTLTLQWFL